MDTWKLIVEELVAINPLNIPYYNLLLLPFNQFLFLLMNALYVLSRLNNLPVIGLFAQNLVWCFNCFHGELNYGNEWTNFVSGTIFVFPERREICRSSLEIYVGLVEELAFVMSLDCQIEGFNTDKNWGRVGWTGFYMNSSVVFLTF